MGLKCYVKINIIMFKCEKAISNLTTLKPWAKTRCRVKFTTRRNNDKHEPTWLFVKRILKKTSTIKRDVPTSQWLYFAAFAFVMGVITQSILITLPPATLSTHPTRTTSLYYITRPTDDWLVLLTDVLCE